MKEKLERLGLAVPKSVADVTDARSAMRQAANVSPAADLGAEILAGKVTAKNAAAKLTAVARQRVEVEAARSLVHTLEPIFAKEYRRAVRESGPEILESLRPVFDGAVAELRQSAEVLGWSPNDRQVVTMGSVAMTALETRKRAIKTLTAVRSVRFELGQSGYGPKAQHVSWYIVGAKDQDELTVAERAFSPGLHSLAAHFELHLNTPEEAETIVATARATSERAKAARLAERAKSVNRVDRAQLAQHAKFLEEVKTS